MGISDFPKPNVKKMKAEGDVEGLIKALSYKDSDVQSKIAVALGEIGKPAVEPLIHVLKDEDSGVRKIVKKI